MSSKYVSVSTVELEPNEDAEEEEGYGKSSKRQTSSGPSTGRGWNPLLLVGLGLVLGAVLGVSMAWAAGRHRHHRPTRTDVEHDFDDDAATPQNDDDDVTFSHVDEVVPDKDDDDNTTEIVTLNGEPDGPKLAWLMSFPNSGTSYTLRAVKTSTGTYVATNYGVGQLNEDGVSVPLFGLEQGPYWTEPLSKGFERAQDGYILTKTHCGGRCEHCGPSQYVETEHVFLEDCLVTTQRSFVETTSQSGKRPPRIAKQSGHYSRHLVQKTIHLIRDPFDNVVSRFHLYFHTLSDEATLKRHSNDRDGFRRYCQDLDAAYAAEEAQSPWLPESVKVGFGKDIPCHADFYRYISWHNHAHVVAQQLHKPHMVLHYESYATDFDATLARLLAFLERRQTRPPKAFVAGKHYADFFTTEEHAAVQTMMKELAHSEVWTLIREYFD